VRSPLARERERATTLLFYGVVLLLGYVLLRIFAPFLAPLGWAAVLAIFVYPWHERFISRYGRQWAAALSTLVVAVLIVGPVLVISTAFIQESRAVLAQIDREALAGQLAVAEQAWDRLRVVIPGARSVELSPLIEQGISRTAGFLASRVGGLLADIVVLLFQLFVMLLALFFFLRGADTIVRELRQVLPFEELRRERMIRQTRDLIYASVAAGLLIATLQGFAGGLLFALLGMTAPVFWGVIMGFLALLPFVGTWLVWLPTAIWLMASGAFLKGMVLAVLGATVVASIDNLLRPAILSGRAQMNGLLMFISLLGGVSVFGLLGIVLGPLVTAIAIGLLEAYGDSHDIVSAVVPKEESKERTVR
jgi:predicted PurR-regulated permease PerM